MKQKGRLFLFTGLLMLFFAFIIMKESRLPIFLTATPFFLIAVYYFIEGRVPKPEYCLYGLTAYLPFSKQLAFDVGYFPSPFTAGLVLSILMLASLAMDPKKRQKLKEKTVLHLPMIILFFLGFISILNGTIAGKAHFSFALYEFLRIWVVPFLIFLAVYHTLDSRKTAENTIVIMMMALAIVSFMTIWEFLTAGDVKLDKSRAAGIANDPNVLAVFLNYMMFVAYGFFLTYWKRPKGWGCLGVFLGALRALIGTFSRGGYLAFAASFFAANFLRKKILLIPLLMGVGLMLMFPKVLPHSIEGRLASTFEKKIDLKSSKVPEVEGSLDRSNRDRIEIWKAGIAMIKDHPLFGVGYTRFVPTVTDYWPEKMPFEAHNTFIFISAEMGIPAGIVFVWILGVFLWQTCRLRRRAQTSFEKALALGLLGAMPSLLIAHLHVIRLDSLEVAGYFWILFGFAAHFNAAQLLHGEKRDWKEAPLAA